MHALKNPFHVHVWKKPLCSAQEKPLPYVHARKKKGWCSNSNQAGLWNQKGWGPLAQSTPPDYKVGIPLYEYMIRSYEMAADVKYLIVN